jgi:hypothetical protein
MRLMRTVHRAVYDKAQQAKHIEALVWVVDDYKLTLQLGMAVGAFTQSTPAAPVARVLARGTAVASLFGVGLSPPFSPRASADSCPDGGLKPALQNHGHTPHYLQSETASPVGRVLTRRGAIKQTLIHSPAAG